LNDHWAIERNEGKIKKYPESSENKNTSYQSLQDASKVVLRGKFIGRSAYI
jgi:hypothetical protein